jgi:hypothetical protein
MTYTPFQWNVLMMLGVLAGNTTDTRALAVLWYVSAILAALAGIVERRRRQ